MLSTENSGIIQPVPVPSAQVPVAPQVFSNQNIEQVDADRVGMESVMQFVANTFAGAQLVDSHSVSAIRGFLWTANVAFIEPLYKYQVLGGAEKLEWY